MKRIDRRYLVTQRKGKYDLELAYFARPAIPWGKMKRVGFSFKVQADKLAEYKEHHENVWPEMLAALHETGWHNYTLFLRDDGLVFGYFETPHSLADAQSLMASKEVNTRWQEFMAPFMEANARPDEMFREWEEVFHLD